MLRPNNVQHVLTDVNEFYNRIPDGFERYNQFCLGTLIQKPDSDKPQKVPVLITDVKTGRFRGLKYTTEADKYLSAQQACELLVELNLHGHTRFELCFIITENDPFIFLDYDDCYDPKTLKLSELAKEARKTFVDIGAAWEISHSGEGCHIFGSYRPGCLPDNLRTTPKEGSQVDGKIECYVKSRPVWLTGDDKSGSALTDISDALPGYLERKGLVSSPPPKTGSQVNKTSGPADPRRVHALLQDMLGHLPMQKEGTRHNTMKAACYDVAKMIVHEHISLNDVKKLIWGALEINGYSKEYSEKKLEELLQAAVQKGANDPDPLAEDRYADQGVVRHPDNKKISADGFLTPHQQREYFKGCYYLWNQNRILTPELDRLKPESFSARYGGYQFGLTGDCSRTTDDAFKAFTRNQGVDFPKYADTCFKPQHTPFEIIDGRVNAWTPPDIDTETGDVTPFLNHVRKLLPGGNDADILLTYMQSLVRNPGIKFQWAPVVQGTEGNGKTLLTRVLSYAIGERYTHLPKAAEVAGRFNDFIENKLFICVEEIMCSGRREVLEILKDVITNERVEVEGKGVSKRMIDNASNWIFMSNHKDGVPKTKNDRRYAVFFTAQQSADDIIRDGMTEQYFKWLFGWLKNGGYKYVAHWLKNSDLVAPEYDPAGICLRAPETTSTLEAIKESYGPLEQEIIEQIEQGVNGFRNGWISANAVSDHFRNLKKSIGPKKIREVIENLGYVYVGRATRKFEGRQPRLYRKKGLEIPKNFTREYESAQVITEEIKREFKKADRGYLPPGARRP